MSDTIGAELKTFLHTRAKELRREQTSQEQALWLHLRAKRFSGFKFRRQQVIGNYIADFVCFNQKVIIELDGSHHSDTKEHDDNRDSWLAEQGFRVLRFWNNEWQSSREEVLNIIWLALKNPSPAPAGHPLPQGEREKQICLFRRISGSKKVQASRPWYEIARF
jgi:hypothetical protein